MIHIVDLIKKNGHVTKDAATNKYLAICGAWFVFKENFGPATCLICLGAAHLHPKPKDTL